MKTFLLFVLFFYVIPLIVSYSVMVLNTLLFSKMTYRSYLRHDLILCFIPIINTIISFGEIGQLIGYSVMSFIEFTVKIVEGNK